MKPTLIHTLLIITLCGIPQPGSGQEALPHVSPISSTKSQTALLLYILLKLAKKTALLKDLDEHYDYLRATEQHALHYGISAVILELYSGMPTQTHLCSAALDVIGYIVTAWGIRILYPMLISTDTGVYCLKKFEEIIIPDWFEDLFPELFIGICSTALYAYLKNR